MLSIIVTSYRHDYFNALSANIGLTIGETPYELIQIWNPGIMSIGEAYNQGAVKSTHDYLLFLHEDVSFKTNNWGKVVLAYLNRQNTGICGLAGSAKQFNLPIGYETGLKKYRHIYVKHQNDELIEPGLKPHKVKTLDGVFLAMTKHLWKLFKFDSSIEGFHCYDLDISLRVSIDYQNYVLPEIIIHHLSIGQFNNAWVKSILLFYKRTYAYDITTNVELNTIRQYWFNRLEQEDISFINKLRYILAMGINLATWKFGVKFLFPKLWKPLNSN